MLNRNSYMRMAEDLVEKVLLLGGHLRCSKGATLVDDKVFKTYQLGEEEKELCASIEARTPAKHYVKLVGGFDAIGQALKWIRTRKDNK